MKFFEKLEREIVNHMNYSTRFIIVIAIAAHIQFESVSGSFDMFMGIPPVIGHVE